MRLGNASPLFGVTAGNMDSMINRYTADCRLRHDDAYTPDNVAGKRPIAPHWFIPSVVKRRGKMYRRSSAVLRRAAVPHIMIDLSDTVRRSVLVDSKAQHAMFGNGERPLVEVVHRLAMGEPISEIRHAPIPRLS
ncbi:hypothetical protein ACLK19_20080 [Escherichia coli]